MNKDKVINAKFPTPHTPSARADMPEAGGAGGGGGDVLGLSTAHISPFQGEAHFYMGGSLAIARRLDRSKPVGGGGKRSAITTFSKASRTRLMRLLATLEREALPIFITLTYPAEYPVSSQIYKRHLDSFAKRLTRLEPSAAFVWRLEFQKRGAPHYHLLVWNVSYLKLLAWVSRAWFEVVGSGDEKHLAAGTRVENIRSLRGLMAYAAKYVGKIDPLQTSESMGHVGRWWGVVGREFLPQAILSVVSLTAWQAQNLIRLFRRFARLKSRDYASLTVFCDADQWILALARGLLD